MAVEEVVEELAEGAGRVVVFHDGPATDDHHWASSQLTDGQLLTLREVAARIDQSG